MVALYAVGWQRKGMRTSRNARYGSRAASSYPSSKSAFSSEFRGLLGSLANIRFVLGYARVFASSSRTHCCACSQPGARIILNKSFPRRKTSVDPGASGPPRNCCTRSKGGARIISSKFIPPPGGRMSVGRRSLIQAK